MRPHLPPGPHVPINRAASSRVANSTPGPSFGSTTRVNLRLKSCFWGFGTAPSYGIEI
jgi:hypothetical protein